MKYVIENLGDRRALFSRLLERVSRNGFDDDFLLDLIAYQRLCPDLEHFDIFYAKYAIAHKNYVVALEHAKKAYEKRKVNHEIWKLLIQCYEALARNEESLAFRAYCCKFYGQELKTDLSRSRLEEELGVLSNAMGIGQYAPFQVSRMALSEGKLVDKRAVLLGEFLPETRDERGYAYWVGVYGELEALGAQGILLQPHKYDEEFARNCGGRTVFDIMRSKEAKEMVVQPETQGVILPVAGVEGKQKVEFRWGANAEHAWVGQWEYSFFRIEEPTRITSDRPLAFGRPIPLGHHPRRKRVVLNILVDALSWNVMRSQQFDCMPNIMEFFSKGIIFNQHFSVAEYTYPSLPTIETGLYPHHSQIFNERKAHPLEERFKTLSEGMKSLGYYCTNIMGGGDALYNGATRGYDRFLVNAYDSACYVGAERAIHQMEAFGECDQFIFFHIMDVHPWRIKDFHIPLATQVRLPLKERLSGDVDVPSPYLPNDEIYQDAYRQHVRAVDRSLGCLFAYLIDHYDEDEFLIQFYSDHGCSIYDAVPDVLSDNQTSTAYMLRGAGVPSCGMVEELTSALDIYPSMAHLAGFPAGEEVDGNLPAVLGGKEREYVISNSIYPGQTYKLCLRTKEHVCSLESVEAVDEDGTADLSSARIVLSTREGRPVPEQEDALMEYFLPLIKEHTKTFDHGGCYWPSMREARPGWFERHSGEG